MDSLRNGWVAWLIFDKLRGFLPTVFIPKPDKIDLCRQMPRKVGSSMVGNLVYPRNPALFKTVAWRIFAGQIGTAKLAILSTQHGSKIGNKSSGYFDD